MQPNDIFPRACILVTIMLIAIIVVSQIIVEIERRETSALPSFFLDTYFQFFYYYTSVSPVNENKKAILL
jgi:hypothetical protein